MIIHIKLTASAEREKTTIKKLIRCYAAFLKAGSVKFKKTVLSDSISLTADTLK
jgi:hypothetical protein